MGFPFKILGLLCVVGAAFFFGGCDFGPTQPKRHTLSADSYEPDAGYGTASSISTDSTVQIHTITTGDVDWISFYAVAGRTYHLGTMGTTDTRIDLYNTDGYTLLAFDDDGGTAPLAWISWTCITSGTYYFKVSGSTASVAGSYGVYVADLSGSAATVDIYESDQNYLSAAAIYTDSTLQTRSISPAGDTDWVSFTAVAGSTYHIGTNSVTDIYTSIYSSDHVTLMYGTDAQDFSWTCATSGTYYLRIRGYFSTTEGSYVLFVKELSTTNNDVYEPDGSYSLATSIPTDSTIQVHSISTGTDTDWVTFTGVAQRRYIIGTNSNLDIYTYVYGADHSTALVATDYNLFYWTCPANGTYSARITGYSQSDTGTYLFYITDLVMDVYENDNDLLNASYIYVDSINPLHTVYPKQDTDWVSFVADSGVTYSIGTNATTDIFCDLYNLDSDVLVMSTDTQMFTWTCSALGTYAVRVRGYSSTTTGAYDFDIIATP